MNAKCLTAEQKKLVLDTYQRFPHPKLVQRKLGYTIHQIRYTLKQAGIKTMRQALSLAFEKHWEIRNLAAAGIHMSEVSRITGVPRSVLKRHSKFFGFSFRKYSYKGANNPNWKGGRNVDADGYALVHYPSHPFCDRHGYVREHRLVMETALNRYLTQDEVVHHKNKNKLDNSIGNLELFPSNADHLRNELQGKVPKWTPEGRAAILKSVRSQKERR